MDGESAMPDLKDKVVADHVFQAIVDRRFYILTHPEYTPMIEARMAALVRGRNPVDLQALAGG